MGYNLFSTLFTRPDLEEGCFAPTSDGYVAKRVIISNPSPADTPGPSNITLDCIYEDNGSCAVITGTTIGGTIGSLTTIDGQGPFTYSIIDDPDGVFDVSGNNLLVGGVIDFDTKETHNVTIRTTDSNAKFKEVTYTIYVIENANGFQNLYSLVGNGTTKYGVRDNFTSIKRPQGWISAWIKTTSVNQQCIVSNVDSSTDVTASGGLIFKMESGNTLKLRILKAASVSEKNFTASCPGLNDGEWHHVLVTWNTSTSVMRFYCDGVILSNTQIANNSVDTVNYNRPDLYIGAKLQNGTLFEYWDGSLDEIVMGKDLLTTTEVIQIYNNFEPNNLLNLFDTSDLIFWYRFEDKNNFPETMDSSGNNRALNLVNYTLGDFSPSVPSRFTNLLQTQFNQIDEYITCGNNVSLDSANIALSAWVTLDQSTSGGNDDMSIIDKTPTQFGFHMQAYEGDFRFFVYTEDSSSAFIVETPEIVGVKTHIVGTYNGATIKVYINGVEMDSLACTGAIEATSAAMRIGSAVEGNNFFGGKIDEVSIWNRGLDAGEVLELYNSGTPANIEDVSFIGDVTSWYRMGDGDTATTIIDNEGPNDGTLVNMDASNYVGV